MRFFSFLLVAQLLPMLLWGQIRLVPQERLDSVKHPPVLRSELLFPAAPIEMGTIPEQGGVWTTEVVWANRGERTPVVITAIKSSCGCLKADYKAEPLKPGEEATLKIHYNPKGHPGAVDQRLFVYTSLSAGQPTAIIRLVGHVQAAADRRGTYPYGCGALLLRQSELLYRGEPTLRVACMNGGAKPLRITEDRLFARPGITLHTRPEVLAPGEEGSLVILIEGEPEFGPQGELSILLGGLDLPPRMRTLRLKRAEE